MDGRFHVLVDLAILDGAADDVAHHRIEHVIDVNALIADAAGHLAK